jgi:transcription-repair coupling factor (superfamily II helicase)
LSPLAELLERAKTSHSVRGVISALEQGTRSLSVSGLSGSAKALLVALVRAATRRPVLVLVSDDDTGSAFYDDLLSLAGSAAFLPSRPDEDEPSTDTAEDRIAFLNSILTEPLTPCIASVKSVLQRVVSPDEFKRLVLELAKGEKMDRDSLVETLNDIGFERVTTVETSGEMAVRGGIVDFYPFGHENPVRVEFSGDEIESMREFDTYSQRSVFHLARAVVLPFREPLPQDQSDISFSSVLEYFDPRTVVVFDEAWLLESVLGESAEDDSSAVRSLLEDLKNAYSSVTLSGDGEFHVDSRAQAPYQRNLKLLKEEITELGLRGYAVFVLSETEGQNERMAEILSETGCAVKVGVLTSGFTLDDARLSVICEKDIFGREPRGRKKFKAGIPVESLLTLKPGDTIVHANYGIGRFEGVERINVRGSETDCLLLVYADGDKIYVPIENMHLVQRYKGLDEARPALTKLGTKSWERAKQRAKKALVDMTRELLDVYAARAAMKGFSYPKDAPWQAELEASFIFDETEDQLKAIADIKADMESDRPMDRLICGEVGYGKTEVALRAAFKAVTAHKQVAVLSPTTILTQQHYNTFKERLKDFPVRCEVFSRFRSAKELKKLPLDLKEGKIDVAIGTHRLLSSDIQFKDLGLLVIDEEQRFGVRHKEKIKKMRKLVDVLTMSATPIPRTLYMSLVGVKDLSTIDTAPKGRLSIHTEVSPWNDDLIADYLTRELDRGGQAYFVHNRVETIESLALHIQKLLPQARVGVAHGQMAAKELESVMIDFLNRVYDVLVTSAIIESGVDIPNVNTMVINRGDRFGLSQLHQLRGRVGRSDRKAYCLILVPKGRKITPEARKRLSAILTHTELGSGYRLALRDLEIRGAGNLLGPEQHGHMQAVGYDLYCDLLAEAVAELKGEPLKKEVFTIVSLDTDAYIPDSYISDAEHKIALYKRLVVISSTNRLQELENELVDRFGPIPDLCLSLLGAVELRLLASRLGVRRIAFSGRWAEVDFERGREPSTNEMEAIIRQWPAPIEFFTERGLKIKVALGEEGLARFRAAKKLLHLLG